MLSLRCLKPDDHALTYGLPGQMPGAISCLSTTFKRSVHCSIGKGDHAIGASGDPEGAGEMASRSWLTSRFAVSVRFFLGLRVETLPIG